MRRIIDLTHDIVTGMPVYPGDPEVEISPFMIHEKDYCHVDSLHIGSHTGTHIDAPFHFLDAGKRITDFPVSYFIGSGVIIDLRTKEENTPITISDLSAYTDLMNKADFCILMTGWDRCWGSAAYERHPYLDPQAARLLVDCGIRIVATDGLNIDSTVTEEFDSHPILLGAETLIVENLTNAEALWDENASGAMLMPGTFSFVPLKLDSSDGAPIRAYYYE